MRTNTRLNQYPKQIAAYRQGWAVDGRNINPFWRSKCSGAKGNYVLNYELSNHLGNVLQVVTDRKCTLQQSIPPRPLKNKFVKKQGQDKAAKLPLVL